MSVKKIFASALLILMVPISAAWAAPETAPTGQEATRALTVIPSFAPVVEKAESAVVNISTVKVIKGRQTINPFGNRQNNPFGGGPGSDFFDHFFGNPVPRGDRKEQSLGSGFIFDPEGFIITNNHVVEGAEDITVKLTSGEEIHADIIGRDPKTDLALIKLKKAGPYPFLALGDSARMRIGDWVVAIGNPFGLEHTVTSGILSARGRAIGAGPYDDFLQTDASINPGNSGGPLLNLEGDVIGINTAIIAGGTGIGFAIPANLAKGVVEQLKSGGRVVRGWMGVLIQPVTPAIAKSYGMDEPHGALIGDIDPEGPGVAAKLERGDIVVSFDGKPIKDWQELPIIVADTEVGKKVKVVVFRNKKEVTLDLTVSELKDDGSGESSPSSTEAGAQLGLSLREITPDVAGRLKLTDREGLYISNIEPGSAAAESGLAAGDVIVEVDNVVIKTMADYNKALSGKKKDDIVRFLVRRGANTMFFTVTVL
ncbi:peptidase [Deltaproteobacteria bacterium Smac51]|nr:peptidase [Deltaproteobacteria bacterium Smac51]